MNFIQKLFISREVKDVLSFVEDFRGILSSQIDNIISSDSLDPAKDFIPRVVNVTKKLVIKDKQKVKLTMQAGCTPHHIAAVTIFSVLFKMNANLTTLLPTLAEINDWTDDESMLVGSAIGALCTLNHNLCLRFAEEFPECSDNITSIMETKHV